MTDRVAIAPIQRYGAGAPRQDQDLVAVEAPLAVTLTSPGGREVALGLLMRTPGDDADLIRGFLYAEGIIHTAADVVDIELGDTARVALAPTVDLDATIAARAPLTTSACGLCGRIEITRADRRGPVPDNLQLSPEMIARLPAALRIGQTVFAETGGLHAAALCDADGQVLIVREDVGRHNAVDKVIGAALVAGRIPATAAVLAVSGRVAYEIVQKAAVAGVAAVVAVGAPSDLAVAAARSAGLTLIGFARDGRFNAYAGFERLVL
jgi:FdhD protein